MYALFSETLDGAVTIRAFDQQVRLCCPYAGNADRLELVVFICSYGFCRRVCC